MKDTNGIDLQNGVLPSHTKIDIWEEYARCVLSWLEPSVYSSLSLDDRPDLIDTSRSLGVEVTQALSSESKEIDSLYSQYCNETNPEKRKKSEGRFLQLGVHLKKYMCLHPAGHDDFSLIHLSHKKKLQLLNQGGYRVFDHNHLFIMSDVLANEKMLENALTDLKEEAIGCAKSFGRVIVAVPRYVYVFNLSDTSYHVVPLSEDKQYMLAMTARQHVLDAEQSSRS